MQKYVIPHDIFGEGIRRYSDMKVLEARLYENIPINSKEENDNNTRSRATCRKKGIGE